MKQEHIEQARHNAGFLAYLEGNIPDSFFDWKVTVCFYQALHLVRAYLYTQGVEESTSHDHTLRCINPAARDKPTLYVPMPDVYRWYFKLHQLSMAARYAGFLQKRSFEQQQRESLEKAKHCLTVIRQALTTRNFTWEPVPKAE